MVPLAKQDDVVLVRRMPSRGFRKQLIDVGLHLPQFVPLGERSKLEVRKLHDFLPWAWTPKNHLVAQPLVASAYHAPAAWREESRDLFRKSWGANCLMQWLCESQRRNDLPNWFSPVDCAGIPVYTASEVPVALAELDERGYSMAIFKPDLAASGRGQRRMSCREPLAAHDESWLRSMFQSAANSSHVGDTESARSPIGIVEPELDRLIDLSFLWFMPQDNQKPNFLGWTRPLVTVGRRYAGTRLGSALSDCSDRLKQFILADRASRIQAIVDWLEPRITSELAARNFTGYFGVDSIVSQNDSGQLIVKPLVELNPRTTMGHVALRLEKHLAPGAEAAFRIFTKAEWDEFYPELSTKPLLKTRDGRWMSGVVWLGEVDDRTKLIPALLIGNDAIAQTGNPAVG